MVFSSSIFLFFFLPAALAAYYFSPRQIKNLVIVIFSLFFYMWGAPKYVFMILISMMVDFYMARAIYQSEGKRKQTLLVVGLSFNIALLLFFKYANFFGDNLNQTLSIMGMKPVYFFNVALPIGISFFTFHEMSYLIDVYRNQKPPMKNIVDYAVYILFFPQLVAGPIIRFHEIADQIKNRTNAETFDNRLVGFFRFVIGLSKKILIANVIGQQADAIFALPESELSTLTCWIGALAYTFQIYFDFSGYSDMAIGIARMMGFVFPENFCTPYISRNISEFWTRWHMTLGRWMRDYLYIPLGGNRVKSKARLYFNLSFVFVVSGLWHGAAWTFVAWGAFHGLFLILDRVFLIKLLDRLGKIPSIVFCFVVAVVGWVIFRSSTFTQAKIFLTKMFTFQDFTTKLQLDSKFWVIMIVATIFSFSSATAIGKSIENKIYTEKYNKSTYYVMTGICLVLLLVSISNVVSSGFNPFIYFRF